MAMYGVQAQGDGSGGGLGSGKSVRVMGLLWALALPGAVQAQVAEKVTIHRDAMGVPHVFADTSAAVMFGAGYALAQDRLAAMEVQRRGAAGRRAEILGASALAGDRTARERRLPDAELLRMYQAIPAEHQAMMQAYVDGINRAVAEVAADPERKTPLEFIRWGIRPTPWTLLEYLRYVASVPGGRDAHEIENLAFLNAMIKRHGEAAGRRIFNDVVPVSDPDSPTVIAAGEDLAPARPVPVDRPVSLRAGGVDLSASPAPPPPAEPPTGASRCLVIGPQKSASGRVLMLEATADGPEIHLRGGGFDQAGFSFNAYGPPFMGRGVQHGWLLTSGVAQANSVFAERLNPKNRYQYWFKGGWRDMERRTETILVNGKTITFRTVVTLPDSEVLIGANAAATAANLAAFLQNSTDPLVAIAAYTVNGAIVTITYGNPYVFPSGQKSAEGNAFTLASGTAGAKVTVSGAALTGGSDPTAKNVSVTTGIGINLLDLARELRLHPIQKAVSDRTDDFVLPLANTPGALTFAYKLEAERIYNVEFSTFPDPTSGQLYRIGN